MKNPIRSLRTFFLALVFVVTGALVAHAADYYVDQNHPSANDQGAGTADQPWKTITKANDTLVAGDTVHIKAGTYNTYIAPKNSGTPAGLITYRNFESDNVTISDAAYGIFLSSKSNIVVQGINFNNLDKFLWLQNGANHNVIANCTFEKARTVGWSGSKIYKNSKHNWIHHSTFSHYGRYTSEDIGSVIDIGDENSPVDFTSHNLIENNVMYHGGHHVMGLYGMYNVVRNNYFHNENWSNGHGNRVVYLNGHRQSSGRNLIEGNRVAYSGRPPDNAGGAGMAIASGNNIVRRNMFYHNNLAGITMTTTPSYPSAPTGNKIYSNTFLNNGFSTDPKAGKELLAAIGFGRYSGSSISGNVVKNNIFRQHPAFYGTYYVSLNEQTIAENWEDAGDPLFVNAVATPGDPMNGAAPDFRLQAASPCIDKGTSLTGISSAAGSGTVFQVQDAGYFSNGWGIAESDTVQVIGTAQTARVLDVNYETNTITVDTPLTWSQNQGIGLAYQGAAPDMGAHEFVPGT